MPSINVCALITGTCVTSCSYGVFPKVFLPIQSHNRAAMQTNSHADTSTDLHSYLCVGIANTNTGNPTFFRPKNATWI